MPHTRLPHDPKPQPPRTRSRFEDGAVDLHAGRLSRPSGERAGTVEHGGPVATATAPVTVPAGGPATHRVDRVAADEIAAPSTPGRRLPRRAGAPPPASANGHARLPLVPLLAAGGLAALGAAAWGLARAGRQAPPAGPSLPAPLDEWHWRGHRVATYGAGDGPPAVLVHSIHAAATAGEMRELFERLSRDRAVRAYDLLGFGASDRPRISYRAEDYVELLGDFLREVAGGPADVVASSLSGAHALAAASRWPERFRSLVLVNPTGAVTLAGGRGPGARLAEAAFRAPGLGDALFGLLTSRPSLAWYDRKAYRHGEALDPARLDRQWTAAHQPNARFAPAAFLGHRLALDVADAVRDLRVPTLTVWTPSSGFQDTDAESRALAQLNPHLESRVIADCGAVPHEERPADFEAVVREWWEGIADAPPAALAEPRSRPAPPV